MSNLPAGWINVQLGDVVDYGNTSKAEPTEIAGDSWILELEDIEKKSAKLIQKVLFSERQSKSTKNKFEKNDVLYGKLRPYLDKVIIANESGYCTTEIIPIKPGKYLDNRFLFYGLKRKEFIDYVSEVSHGLNMPRLGTKQGQAAPFVLAPLNEQIRIADKLDSVLAKVDAAQARLEKIPTLLKRFRQSVLAAATSGELTKEWREQTLIDNLSESELKSNIENEWFSSKQREFIRKNKFPKSLNWRDKVIDPNIEKLEVDTWFSLTLESIAEIIDPNPSHRMPNYVEDGVPFISSENIFGNDEIDFTVGKKITNDELKKQKERYEITNNSFAFTRIGTVGKSVKLALPHNYGISHAMAVVTPFDNLVNGQFLRLIMSCTSTLQQASDGVQSVGVPDLGIGKMKNFRIPFPPMAEQTEIVRRVESLFTLADTVEKQYLETKKRIDRLTQSLLAKAFRGELVPQDPNDEPAAELLKRIQAERNAQPPVKNKRKQQA
ncbi:MAG: restriction endonuclease subunit S [Methylobacter sp.]|uniref:restriction endonuclease subunit S n=1 Tax=Methylobacter sp. TaxID=2051955 RepID=UPI00258EAF40|nr:restriction endonuclease subunit S [Methylobacter sp.]MCL7421105.1 restriction endonuclease subunit S [Methylobacter sp.]